MKTKIAWFIIGFVASWLTWSVISYVRLRPKDNRPVSIIESDEWNGLEWLGLSKGRELGAFMVYTAADPSDASAMIYPSGANGFPKVLIQDIGKRGKLDGIIIYDSVDHTICATDTNGDGVLDMHDYSPDGRADSTSYTDCNMDGQYDMRLNQNNSASIFIDSKWYDLIDKDKERYIKVDDELRQVKCERGVWKIKEEQ